MGPAGVLIAAVIAAPALGGDGAPTPHEARVGDAAARIEGLRQLAFLRDVEVRIQTEDELRHTLQRELALDLTDEWMHGVRRALVAFGQVDPDYDLQAIYEAILVEQVAGYYDPRRRELYVIDRPSPDARMSAEAMDAMVTEHELVHALQDQHFDLYAITERDFDNDDVSIAVRCLIEGDATYVMLASTVGAFGIDVDDMDVSGFMADLGDTTEQGGPMISGAPPILTRGLVLPYTAGAGLVEGLRLAGGWDAVDTAFRERLPLSTEQVLHPERFLGESPDWPQRVELPELEAAYGDGWTWLYANTMGELHTVVLFEQWAPDAAVAAADGWDGDRYAVYERGGDEPASLVWWSTWDDEREAKAFRAAAGRFVAERHPEAKRRRSGPGLITWRDGPRAHRVEQRGTGVLVLTSVPRGAIDAVAAATWDGTTAAEARTLDDYAAKPAPWAEPESPAEVPPTPEVPAPAE